MLRLLSQVVNVASIGHIHFVSIGLYGSSCGGISYKEIKRSFAFQKTRLISLKGRLQSNPYQAATHREMDLLLNCCLIEICLLGIVSPLGLCLSEHGVTSRQSNLPSPFPKQNCFTCFKFWVAVE